jgi:hypothetical protein
MTLDIPVDAHRPGLSEGQKCACPNCTDDCVGCTCTDCSCKTCTHGS